MSVRVKVAVALVVAAAVPLLGVFAVVGVLLPTTIGSVDRGRLGEVAAATSAVLVADCVAAGDRAQLIASRLQTAVAVADSEVDPAQAVVQQSGRVVSRATAPDDSGAVLVLDPQGVVLTSTGPAADAVAADLGAYLGRSCGEGVLGEPAALVVELPFDVAAQPLGTVLVVSPLDTAAADRLTETVGLDSASLVLLGRDGAVTTSSGLAADAPDGRAQQVQDELVAELAASGDDGEGPSGDAVGARSGGVVDRHYAAAPPVLRGALQVAVVAAPRAPVERALAIAFVVTAFGTAVLVWLLSETLTRPLTELAELARRIAAGEDPAGGSTDVSHADADSDVLGVSAVLGSLARELRASEADVERRQGAFLDAFSRFGDALQRTHDRDGLLQTVLQAALLAAEAPMGLTLHTDRSFRRGRRVLSLRARSPQDGPDGPAELDAGTRRTLTLLAERALAEQAVIEVPGSDAHGPLLAVPLGSAGRPLGAVVVAREAGARAYDTIALQAIGALARNAGTALGNIKEHQEAERLSVTDPLTGVHNFRHLSTMLARELERATRFGHPLGVCMLDIDRFKPVNDTHGHAAGDAVLRELARRVAECVREVDTLARYGGEEFALLLPETDVEGAVRLGERVLARIRSEPFRLPDGTTVPITASLGVAVSPTHGSTATAVMRSADEALYRAKSGGRDRVEVASREPQPSPPAAVGSPERDGSP